MGGKIETTRKGRLLAGCRKPIEQAIARGWTISRIMKELGFEYEVVKYVRDSMLDRAYN